MVIRKAKIIEHDKLILNSHNKVKTTWGVTNKEPGRNKKRREKQALKVEGEKITDQQTVAETFNEYFVAIAENFKRQSKNNFTNDDSNNIVIPILWNKLLINLTQVWNATAQQQKKLKEL
jgi:hypothetical protein